MAVKWTWSVKGKKKNIRANDVFFISTRGEGRAIVSRDREAGKKEDELFTSFLPQRLDEGLTKFLRAHLFSRVGMCQERLEIIRIASNLRAGNHAYERDQIIGHWEGGRCYRASS